MSENERLVQLRKEVGLSQEKFAAKINMSRTGLATIEQGMNKLTDRIIADICREFNANENWLRTGEGEMFRQPNDIDVELGQWLGKILKSDDKFVKEAMIGAAKIMMMMTPEQQEQFKDIIKKLAKTLEPE